MSVFGSKIEDFYQSGHSQPKLGMSAGPPLRFMIVGKSKAGKSMTGNLFLGKKDFISGCSGHSVTKPRELGIKNRFLQQICVVDTPGLIADRDDNESIQKEIKKFIGLTCPAPHAMILEVSIGRFTEERVETVNRFFITNCKLEQYKIFQFTRFDSKDKQSDFLVEWSVEENKLVKIRKSEADKSETRTTILLDCLYSLPINPSEWINSDYQCFENRNDQKEMKYPICLQSHGRHAVVQSQPIGRFTEEDEETVKYSQSYLGENLVGMILLIVTFLATIRKKKVQVLSTETAKFWQKIGTLPITKIQLACLARSKDGPVRITKNNLGGENSKGTLPLREDQYYSLMKSHGLAIDDIEKIKQHCSPGFPHADNTKLPVTTKSILDSVIISGGMEKDPNYVCERGLKKCQMCIDRNEASYWCNTCKRNICNFCKLYHEKVWMVKNHNVQALL